MNKVFPSANGVTVGDMLSYDPTKPDQVAWATPPGGGSGAPTTAEYVVVSLNAGLSAERRLQVGTGLSLTDGGANGDITIAPALDLAAVEALATNGLAVRTGTSTWTTRTLTGPAAGITVTDGDGVAGNPTLALANDLAALEGLSTTGLAARTAASTWTTRTITAPAAGITVSNGDGVSGNPTLALANDLSALEALSSTGIAVRSAADTWVQRTITAGGGITVTNGDGVSGNPTIATTATTFTVTSTGYTTVSLPSDARAVGIRCKGGGGGAGAGTTGTTAANRAGGGGGGSSGGMDAVFDRGLFDTSLEVYVGAGGAGGIAGGSAGVSGLISTVEITNTGLDGTSVPQASSTVVYSGGRAGNGGSGITGGAAGGGGATATVQNALFARAAWGSPNLETANGGTAGGASGTPSDNSPFSLSTGPSAGGAGGAGFATAGPTQAAGGKHAAFGHIGATTGGVAGGGAGNTPSGIIGSTVDRQLAYYGGTGGGSNVAGAGGQGGAGEESAGGGGGGAGTTTGGTGGQGGNGFVVIRVFG